MNAISGRPTPRISIPLTFLEYLRYLVLVIGQAAEYAVDKARSAVGAEQLGQLHSHGVEVHAVDAISDHLTARPMNVVLRNVFRFQLLMSGYLFGMNYLPGNV